MSDIDEDIIINSQNLDKIWIQWLAENTSQQTFNRYGRSYQYVGRRDIYAQQFEIWVFQQGGTIRQRNGKRYIVFNDAAQASFFMLKYA